MPGFKQKKSKQPDIRMKGGDGGRKINAQCEPEAAGNMCKLLQTDSSGCKISRGHMFPPAVVVGLILVKREQFTIFDLTKVGSAVCSFNDGRNSV